MLKELIENIGVDRTLIAHGVDLEQLTIRSSLDVVASTWHALRLNVVALWDLWWQHLGSLRIASKGIDSVDEVDIVDIGVLDS